MKWTNEYGLPKPIEIAVIAQSENHKLSEGVLTSTTGLIKEPLIGWLQRRYADKLVSDVSDRIWMLDGSLTHDTFAYAADEIKEKCPDISCTSEKTLTYDVFDKDGTFLAKIEGTYDYMLSGSGELMDYKKTSIFKIKDRKETPANVWDDEWVLQLNQYRLMHNAKCEEKDKINKLSVWAIIRDWGPRYAKIAPRNTMQFVLPILPDDEMKYWMIAQTKRHLAALTSEGSPPFCSAYNRWYRGKQPKEAFTPGGMCAKKKGGYCGVADYCPYMIKYKSDHAEDPLDLDD